MDVFESAARATRGAVGLSAWSLPVLAVALAGALLVLSIVDHAVWRPLPYPDADRLGHVFLERDGDRTSVPLDTYRALESGLGSRAMLAGTRMDSLVLVRDGIARRVVGAHVTPRWFDVHGMPPASGRYFDAADFAQQGLRGAVLSHRGWSQLFGADPSIVGRDIEMDGTAYRVIGIAPPGLELQFRADVALAHAALPAADDEIYPVLRALGDTAVPELDAIARTVQAQIEATSPSPPDGSALRVVGSVELVSARVRPVARALLVAMVAVLLAAAASFANQVVLHAMRRERRVATSLAIGATPRRLVVQSMLEAAVAVAAAAVVAIALAGAAIALLPLAGAPWIPRAETLSLSLPALALAAAMAGAIAIAGGSIGGLVAARQCDGFAAALSTRGASTTRSASALKHIALFAQVVLSTGLAIGCAQVATSLHGQLDIDLGFEPGERWTASVAFPPALLPTGIETFDPAQRQRFGAFMDAAERAVGDIPGVEAAGFSFLVPVVDNARNATAVAVVGEAASPGGERPARLQFASPGYFAALGLPLRRGEGFKPLAVEDRMVALVNETMAREWFGTRDPLGERLAFDGRTVEIVGVVPDVRQAGVRASPEPEFYVPANAFPAAIEFGLVVHARRDLASLGTEVRKAIAAVDPGVPVYGEIGIASALDRQVADLRFLVLATWLFGITAMLSALGGLLTVGLQAIVQERTALAVRSALGATGGRLARGMVLRFGMLLLPGVVLGAVLQSTFGRWALASLVPETSSLHVWSAIVAALVVGVLFALALAPTVTQAWRVDPRDALRG